jgi:hypothetical protein
VIKSDDPDQQQRFAVARAGARAAQRARLFTDRIDPRFQIGDLVAGKRSVSRDLGERVALAQRSALLIGRQVPGDTDQPCNYLAPCRVIRCP